MYEPNISSVTCLCCSRRDEGLWRRDDYEILDRSTKNLIRRRITSKYLIWQTRLRPELVKFADIGAGQGAASKMK